MNACEIAALLSGSVQRYEPKGSGATNELERLSFQEVAYGLAGADRIGSLLVRVKWAGDLSSLYPLFEELRRLLIARAVAKKWGVRRLDYIGGIVLLALVEQEVIRVDWHKGEPKIVAGARKCPVCKGTKYRFSRRYGKWYACRSCNASGQYLINEARRAADCGMSVRTWRRYWKPRFMRLRALLGRIESRALRSIRMRVLEGDEPPAQSKKERTK